MPQREKVPATAGQMGEIAGALIGEMDFSKDEAKVIIGNMGSFRKDLRQFYRKYHLLDRELARWAGVYKRLFGRVPTSPIIPPERPVGLGPMRLIVVAQEIVEWTNGKPLQGMQDALRKQFPCWVDEADLDETITKSDRGPRNGSYAIWARDVREADPDLINQSAKDLVASRHVGITLLERQLMEADYFWERGEHLDHLNVTLCTGSRDHQGNVPCADWRGGFYIRVVESDFRTFRSRRVWV